MYEGLSKGWSRLIDRAGRALLYRSWCGLKVEMREGPSANGDQRSLTSNARLALHDCAHIKPIVCSQSCNIANASVCASTTTPRANCLRFSAARSERGSPGVPVCQTTSNRKSDFSKTTRGTP